MTDFHFKVISNDIRDWTKLAVKANLGTIETDPNTLEKVFAPAPGVNIDFIDDLVTANVEFDENGVETSPVLTAGLHVNLCIPREHNSALHDAVVTRLRNLVTDHVHDLTAAQKTKLRRIMEAKGYTLAEIAERIGAKTWKITDNVAFIWPAPRRPKRIWYGDPAPEE